ncbi:DUF2711 domain-containing protein [Sutcliffiella horikoshii]|uniref:DUF2711 family protein n=1 Tax=Sutcliffiella horikoshii TaxID=79883 RepID=UPI00203A71E9|nr:DUF2711 family protein [Sutcliffiella horikoshii]MCM3619893.1 DUF2711 domain-containing protein [Sutcliffiella horikoshii]
MIDYIWLTGNSPLLKQLPEQFISAAFLLHPFEKMPDGWEGKRRMNKQERFFPTDEEKLVLGKAVKWEEVRNASGLNSLDEVAIALQTFFGALNREYERKDLKEKLSAYVSTDLYLPVEDSPSLFIAENLMRILSSKGANKLIYSDPIHNKSGSFEISSITPLELSGLAYKEILITDENQDFAFMNVIDSFATVLMSKEENLDEILNAMKMEAVICDENTYVDWYFDTYFGRR